MRLALFDVRFSGCFLGGFLSALRFALTSRFFLAARAWSLRASNSANNSASSRGVLRCVPSRLAGCIDLLVPFLRLSLLLFAAVLGVFWDVAVRRGVAFATTATAISLYELEVARRGARRDLQLLLILVAVLGRRGRSLRSEGAGRGLRRLGAARLLLKGCDGVAGSLRLGAF